MKPTAAGMKALQKQADALAKAFQVEPDHVTATRYLSAFVDLRGMMATACGKHYSYFEYGDRFISPAEWKRLKPGLVKAAAKAKAKPKRKK